MANSVAHNPTILTTISQTVDSLAAQVIANQTSRKKMIQTMLETLSVILKPTFYYMLVISKEKLASCPKADFHHSVIYERNLKWKTNETSTFKSTHEHDFKILIFKSGEITLDSIDNKFKSYGFTNGFRSGPELRTVQWLDKQIKKSDWYGQCSNGSPPGSNHSSLKYSYSQQPPSLLKPSTHMVRETTGRLDDAQLARIEFYHDEECVYGLRFVFADGRTDKIGRMVGSINQFLFYEGESLMGVSIKVGQGDVESFSESKTGGKQDGSVCAIQFKTTMGRASDFVGYTDPDGIGGCFEFELAFNNTLKGVCGLVGDYIECLKFEWL
ncbi:unnamed protein product [Ambrosiozyma monospora]|uniref:Unnamed protein product n=1 Tax=Ambrosiozyma monospora TaxID=43982 RepID=A0ACB5TKA6_AMBMO|nr:unnamed protein product [Ambrosiozyma monospora]